MNRKQERTLQSIFEHPVRADIDWRDVTSLLLALGADVTAGKGSRRRVVLNDVKAVFHEPHPRKEVGKDTVRSLRDFLTEAGIISEQL
jgi:hypothetical protein